MPKYLCLQRRLDTTSRERPSPAEMETLYEQFNAWRERFQENLVDLGGRLGSGKLVTSDPAADGPLIEVKELVGGYMIVSAATLDAAIEVARSCPGLMRPGSGVEVIAILAPG